MEVMADRLKGTISVQDYVELQQRTAVTSESYTKPIRLYCDVDGVIQPHIYGEEDLKFVDTATSLNIINNASWGHEDASIPIVEGDFYYNKRIAEKLSEWSRHPLIDFVWLTAWRVNAPYALDEKLNIQSIGWLPWSYKMTDYNHSFKTVAIREDQKNSPSSFIWLEDLANRIDDPEEPELFTTYEYDYEDEENWNTPIRKRHIHPSKYLSVNTDSLTGLTEENIALVDEWIQNFK